MNRLIINILKEGKGDDKKTAVFPSRKVRKLGRRRSRQIYLNYYDLGQFANGADVDFSYDVTIDEVRRNFGDEATEVVYNYNDFSADLLSYYTAIDRDTWTTEFARIDDARLAEYQGFDSLNTFVTGGDTWVEGKGFLPNDSELATGEVGVQSLRHFYNVNTGFSGYKVTSEPDFSSAEVPFTLDKSCDVFLIPHIQLWEGGNYYDPLGDPVDTRTQILGLFLAPFSREFTIDNATWDAYTETFEDYLDSLVVPGNRWLLKDSFSDAYHQDWVDLFKNHPACRMYQYDPPGGLFTLEEGDLSLLSPSGFLDGTAQGIDADFAWQPAGSPFHDWLFGPWLGLRRWHQPAGQLQMVVKKLKSTPEWYYVWRETASDVPLNHNAGTGLQHPTSPSAGFSYGGVHWYFTAP